MLQKDNPFAAVSKQPIQITSFEYTPDAYKELLKLEKNGEDKPDYIAFLKDKFPFLNRENI